MTNQLTCPWCKGQNTQHYEDFMHRCINCGHRFYPGDKPIKRDLPLTHNEIRIKQVELTYSSEAKRRQAVVRLRSTSHTIAEIAEILNIPKSIVGRECIAAEKLGELPPSAIIKRTGRPRQPKTIKPASEAIKAIQVERNRR